MKIQILFFTINLSLVFGGLFDNVKYDMDKGVHVIKKGERQSGDELLFSEKPIEKGQLFPPKHVGNELCYPPKSNVQPVKITSYEVKDLDSGSDGGVAFDVSGGVGQSQVCVFLKTRYGGSYHYQIDVYGIRLNNAGLGGNFGGSGYGRIGGGHFGGVGGGNYGGMGSGNYGGMGGGNYGGAGGYGSGSGMGYGDSNVGSGYGNSGYGNSGYGNSGAPYNNPTGHYGIDRYGNVGAPFQNRNGYNNQPTDQGTNRYSPGNERY